MYTTLLLLHSLLRWVILITALWALIRAWRGLTGNHAFLPADKKSGLFFMISADIQFALGLLLYFVARSFTKQALSNMKAAMKDTDLRFWSVEHALLMVIAWLLIHIGYAKSKKGTDKSRFKSAAIFYTIAVVLVLAAIPWATRPLFRF